jgi:hypothetical protein
MKTLTMKNNLYFTLVLVLNAVLAHSQVELPYTTGFDNTQQQEGWTIFRLGENGQFNNWVYSNNGAHSAPSCLYHNYPVGGTNVTDDWFVSPMMNLESGGVIESVWHSFAGFGVPQTADTVAIYLLIGSSNPSLASERILLHDYRADYQNDNTWYETQDIPIPEAASISYIAFRYKTIVNWLDVKFDDLSIVGMVTSVAELETSPALDFKLYPNPTDHFLRLDRNSRAVTEPIVLSIYNGAGSQVMHHVMQSSQTEPIDVESLPVGIYTVVIQNQHGRSSQRFIKQ